MEDFLTLTNSTKHGILNDIAEAKEQGYSCNGEYYTKKSKDGGFIYIQEMVINL